MFPLHPETPENGQLLQDLFQVSSERIESMVKDLQRTALSLGLDFGSRSMTFNSRRAQELGLWAADKGFADSYDMAMFRAYFVYGTNIAEIEELLKIVDEIGLDVGTARSILDNGTYAEALDREWQEARKAGVQAIPTFNLGKNSLVGAKPYKELQKLLNSHGVPYRNEYEPLPLFKTCN